MFRYSYDTAACETTARKQNGINGIESNSVESPSSVCSQGKGIKIFHKDCAKLEFRPQLRRAGRGIYTVVICVIPAGQLEHGGEEATRDAKCHRPGECRKVNGILSSAYAEKFHASVSAFTSAARHSTGESCPAE